MKTYAVKSMESIYQGMHGIVSRFLMQTDSLDEVHDAAKEESLNVIEDFGLCKEEEEEDFDIDDCVMYSMREVPDYKGHTYEELEEMFNYSPEEFIETYCTNV